MTPSSKTICRLEADMAEETRRVHGISQSGGEIVRYERAGKWYVEYTDPPQRMSITVGDAALFATADRATFFLELPGGQQFDALVRRHVNAA